MIEKITGFTDEIPKCEIIEKVNELVDAVNQITAPPAERSCATCSRGCSIGGYDYEKCHKPVGGYYLADWQPAAPQEPDHIPDVRKKVETCPAKEACKICTDKWKCMYEFLKPQEPDHIPHVVKKVEPVTGQDLAADNVRLTIEIQKLSAEQAMESLVHECDFVKITKNKTGNFEINFKVVMTEEEKIILLVEEIARRAGGAL